MGYDGPERRRMEDNRYTEERALILNRLKNLEHQVRTVDGKLDDYFGGELADMKTEIAVIKLKVALFSSGVAFVVSAVVAIAVKFL